MKEQMQDQVRQWFIETRDATGKFPEFPSTEEGGSAAIFKMREEPVRGGWCLMKQKLFLIHDEIFYSCFCGCFRNQAKKR